jgi:hypothetical protein
MKLGVRTILEGMAPGTVFACFVVILSVSGLMFRNFPGLDGKPPLTIPASSFVLHFHSDGSNNDWGYKIKVEPDEINPEVLFTEDNVNSYPFYCGNGPIYSSSYPSMNGQIARLVVIPTALSATDVESHFSSSEAPEAVCRMDNSSGIASLSLLLRGIKSVSHQLSLSNLERGFAAPHVLKSLLLLLCRGTSVVQIAICRVLASLVPKLDVEVVNNVFLSIPEFSACKSFVHYLLSSAGSALYTSADSSRQNVNREHEFSFAVAVECLGVLRTVVTVGKPCGDEETRSGLSLSWRQAINQTLQDIASSSSTVFQTLLDNKESLDTVVAPSEVFSVVGVIAFAGGLLPGIYPGAQCHYLNDKGLSETCTVISSTAKPIYDPVSDKELFKKWKDIEQFGEAVVIILNSDPEKPITVPRQSLSITRADLGSDLSVVLTDYFGEDDGASTALLNLLKATAHLDVVDYRPVMVPKVEEKAVELVFESSHPYTDGLDVYTSVSIPGAEKMFVSFRNDSRIEQVSELTCMSISMCFQFRWVALQ